MIALLDCRTIETLTDDAARIESVAAGTVHHALHALLISTMILHALHQMQADNPASNQLTLEDIDVASREELMNYLVAVFDGLEHFLFRPADGAGSAICVAIGILFVVTIVLRRATNTFHIPMLKDAGVERVLQALFGLHSITYRSTGILNVLQTFSGRELDASKFCRISISLEKLSEGERADLSHADTGGPSPDILEALHELLCRHDSASAGTATASLELPSKSGQVPLSSSSTGVAVALENAQSNMSKPHAITVTRCPRANFSCQRNSTCEKDRKTSLLPAE
ncbi:MAG: hypothetical protein Q9213_005829 [Squamulea squamosa]